MTPGLGALIALSVIASGGGQLLLKSGARELAGLPAFALFKAALASPRIWAGVAAWILSTGAWIFVLSRLALSRVYCVMSLNYLLVPLAAVWLFGETLSPVQLTGSALIAIGVGLVLLG